MTKCSDIGALFIKLPFGHSAVIGLVDDNHVKHVTADIAASFFSMSEHPGWHVGSFSRLVDPFAEREVEVAIPGREFHTAVALSCCDQLDRCNRPGTELARIHLEVFSFEVAV